MSFQGAELANGNIEVGMSFMSQQRFVIRSVGGRDRQPDNNAGNAVKVMNSVFNAILLGVIYTTCR